MFCRDLSCNVTCSASLVSDSLAITAKHCVHKNTYGVGQYHLKCGGTKYDHSEFIVSKIMPLTQKPFLNITEFSEFAGGDIALIKIKKVKEISRRTTKKSKIIRLAKNQDEVLSFFQEAKRENRNQEYGIRFSKDQTIYYKRNDYSELKLKSNGQCYIFGHGRNHRRLTHYTTKMLVPNDDLRLFSTNEGAFHYLQYNHSNHKRKVLFSGDSGGPLCCVRGDECIQIAVASTNNPLWSLLSQKFFNKISKVKKDSITSVSRFIKVSHASKEIWQSIREFNQRIGKLTCREKGSLSNRIIECNHILELMGKTIKMGSEQIIGFYRDNNHSVLLKILSAYSFLKCKKKMINNETAIYCRYLPVR